VNHQIKIRDMIPTAAPTLIAVAAFFLLWKSSPIYFEKYSYLMSPAAVFVSVLTAIITGWIFTSHTVKAQTQNAKVKAAYDACFEKQWDEDYIKARSLYVDLILKEANLAEYLSFEKTTDDETRDITKAEYCEAVRNIANDLELTAVGIKQNILDEDFISLMYRGSMKRDFKKLKPYIDAVRTQAKNDKIYIQFDELIVRWENEDREE
ncbi:MAG: hypothetical protein JWM58_264, partial [Rhizobium sp.]|nr:hypothetical protein [Rhizobium sp.]